MQSGSIMHTISKEEVYKQIGGYRETQGGNPDRDRSVATGISD